MRERESAGTGGQSAPRSGSFKAPAIRPWLKNIPAILGVALLIGAVYVVQHEFRHLSVHDVARALHAMPAWRIWLAGLLTIASYGLLTIYDRLATIYAGHRVSYRRTAFASFCAYALAHNLGFAAVSGAAVRYRLYAHWGLDAVQIGKVIAFCSLTFGLGGMVLGGAILIGEPSALAFTHLPRALLIAVGILAWLVAGGYVLLAARMPVLRLRGRLIELPRASMAVAQVGLATADVALTALIFYSLLPHAHGLTFLRFLAVYLASYAAGLIANVPGGLGVFDAGMLLGLADYLPTPVALSAMFLFRLYYYIIPLFLAGALFAGNEVMMRSRALVPGAAARPRWSEPDLAAAATTGGVAVCGAMLLSVGILDTRPDYSWMDTDFAAAAASAGQYLPSLIGTALMVLTIGLAQRVTLAWWASILLLLAGAALTALQGEPDWVPAILTVTALSMAPFRDAYYRHARLIAQPLRRSTLLPLLALLASVVWLASFEPRVRYLAQTSWWEVVLSREAPNSLRLAIGLAAALGFAALWGVMRPSRVRFIPWNAEGRLRYAALGALPPPEADGLVMGELGRAGIPFRRIGRVLLGLGDPAGADSDRVSAVWRLRDLAEQEGGEAAIWRAGPQLLKVYADLGLTAVPLGRDGLPAAQAEAETARQFLCVKPERDLGAMAPCLASLGRRRILV